MNGALIILFLIISSSIPVILIYFWFRLCRYPFSAIKFLLALFVGMTTIFPALIFRLFIPGNFPMTGRLGVLAKIFLPAALPEELSRLIVLIVFLFITNKIKQNTENINISETQDNLFTAQNSAEPEQNFINSVTKASAIGMIAGFGFAIIESAVYAASQPEIILLRMFSAAAIHGACGARIGSAAALLKNHTSQAFVRFLTAVVIHGIYNYMIVMHGFASVAAVLIALFSLASSVFSIHIGMKKLTHSLPKSH